jgi:hypothetical protein
MFMERDNNFSAQESLQLIESMLQQVRNKFNNESFLYLLWGWVIFFCATGHFILVQYTAIKNPEIIWATTWLAVIFQIVYLVRKQKKEMVKTYADQLLSHIWVSFGISMGICSFVSGREQLWQGMYPIFLVLYGMPTFLSGAVMQFKPLVIGGICCWGLAIVAAFTPILYVLLLLALAVVVAWIIPGYLLRAKFKKERL